MFNFETKTSGSMTRAVCQDTGIVSVFESTDVVSEVSTFIKDSDNIVHRRILVYIDSIIQYEESDSFYFIEW